MAMVGAWDGIYVANIMALSALLCRIGWQKFPNKSLYAWCRGGFKKPIWQEMAGKDGILTKQGNLC